MLFVSLRSVVVLIFSAFAFSFREALDKEKLLRKLEKFLIANWVWTEIEGKWNQAENKRNKV